MVDIKVTESGELILTESGDLAITYGDEQVAQEVLFRLKTTRGDWMLSPDVGASLEEFIGEPNIPLIHAMIENRVVNTLLKGNLLFSPSVQVIPIGVNEVLVIVEFGSIEDDERVIQIQAGLDLREGLVFSRIDSRLR